VIWAALEIWNSHLLTVYNYSLTLRHLAAPDAGGHRMQRTISPRRIRHRIASHRTRNRFTNPCESRVNGGDHGQSAT